MRDLAPDRRRAWRGRPAWLAAASVLLVIVLGAVGSITFLQPSSAVAATPRLLTPEPILGTAGENLMSISDARRAAGQGGGGTIRFQSWALAFDPDAGSSPRFIAPEQHQIEHLPDGSVRVTVRAGTPYAPSGSLVSDPTPAPGTVLWSDVQAAADVVTVFGAPPTVASRVGEYLEASGTVPHRTSGEYFSAIRLLLSEKQLSSEEEAALIAFLATLPDVEVEGSVTDRLGRLGVAFSTESRSPGEYRDTLVLSASEGVLSYEVTYIGSSRTDIQAPAVIEYIAWE
ncbi:hypothetical protein [Microbacterium sp. RURRCA19A]|uniref:hypothetical protein n=1 Tax=Microbacterium sp. RURRCA19A TaxID=1907391 RepID=UPI001115752E|nr:hypothetical protein [Microbacterium sp. RURRCA19A]